MKEQKEKQDFIIIGGVKIPYIIDNEGVEWYPARYLQEHIILKNSKIDFKKYNNVKKKIIDFSFITGNNNVQETNCFNKLGLIEWMNSIKRINYFSEEQMNGINSIRKFIGMEEYNIYNESNNNTYINDIINNIKYKDDKICIKCNHKLPKHKNFFCEDERNSHGLVSVCRECYTNNGRFIHPDKYLQYIYYKYGEEKFIKIKNSKIEDIFVMYGKNEIDKLPDKHITKKKEQFSIIKELFNNNLLTYENISLKYINNIYFKNTALKVSIEEIFNYCYPDWKDYPLKYGDNTPDIRNKTNNDLKHSKVIWNNYLKQNNIIIDDIYNFNYIYHFKICKIYKFAKNDLLKYIMFLYDNKYPSYKFNIKELNYYKEKENRIFAFKQYVKELNIHYSKIPLVISKYTLQQYSNTLYNILRNYYDSNLFKWVNECYPNKFKHEDFNLECIRGRFDSMDEESVDLILREYFK